MKPYLSIVMAASNQANGRGDFLNRMQNCIDSIFRGALKYDLNAELVIVEFGPPADRPTLNRALDWTDRSIPVRIITVPQSVVRTIENPYGILFYENWAKSVGIRRAGGEFILTTNADSIYSDQLVKFLSEQKLNCDYFYRVDRHDMKDGQVIRTHYATLGSYERLHFNAAGEFILMSGDKYREIRGFAEVPYWGNTDGMTVLNAHNAGLRQVILPYPLFHEDHPRSAHYSPPWDDASPYTVLNSENWGFAREIFEEIIIGRKQ